MGSFMEIDPAPSMLAPSSQLHNLAPQPPVLGIPLELHEQIVDYLWNDRRTLKSCSMAHRIWLSGARYHLFDSVCIRSTVECLSFRRLLDSSSSLLSVDLTHFVRKMIFQDLPFRDLDAMRLGCSFSRLYNVTTLELRFWPEEELPDRLVEGLSIAFPNITSLELEEVNFLDDRDFLQLLCGFPRLSAIRVTDIQDLTHLGHMRPLSEIRYSDGEFFLPGDSGHIVQGREGQFRSIHELDLTESTYSAIVATWLMRFPFRLALRKLCISWSCGMAYFETFDTLLNVTGPHLEYLKIGFPKLDPTSYRSLLNGFRSMRKTNITTLHLSDLVLNPHLESAIYQSPWVEVLLGQICSGPEHLKLIHFDLDIGRDLSELDTLDWRRIDDAFAHLVWKFPLLRARFSIRKLQGTVAAAEDVKLAELEIIGRLPLSHAFGSGAYLIVPMHPARERSIVVEVKFLPADVRINPFD